MAVGDLFEVVLVYHVQGNVECRNVLHYTQLDDPQAFANPFDAARSIIDAVQADVLPAWQAMVTQETELGCIIARRHWPDPSPPVTTFVSPPLTGNVTEDSLPAQDAQVICKRGQLPGQQIFELGRIFISGVAQAWYDAGQLIDTFAPLVDALATAIAADIQDPTGNTQWAPCIFSPTRQAAQEPVFWYDIVEAAPNVILNTQRGRRSELHQLATSETI